MEAGPPNNRCVEAKPSILLGMGRTEASTLEHGDVPELLACPVNWHHQSAPLGISAYASTIVSTAPQLVDGDLGRD